MGRRAEVEPPDNYLIAESFSCLYTPLDRRMALTEARGKTQIIPCIYEEALLHDACMS